MTQPSDAHSLARIVHDKGGLLSVNHDKPDIPWNHDLPAAACQEVWQSTWMAWNWVSLGRWQSRLARGLRLSAIGGSDYHQPELLRPEGPLVLARPTTVLWLPELSEDAILAAMKSGRGYITESPGGPHLEIVAGDTPMGGTAATILSLAVTVRGAAGDDLTLWDATGEIACLAIPTADWQAEIRIRPRGFVRAEIVAQHSRPALMDALRTAFGPGALPMGLTETDMTGQPLRRALSNPIYLKG
jgi:hypothetical protein